MRLLRLPDSHLQTLRGLADTSENPFYWRERRINARKREPWKSLWNTSFLLAFFFMVVFAGLWLYITSEEASGIFERGHVPAWLGGQDGGRAIFAVVAGLHALIIYYTAKGLANAFLVGEARQGALFHLLMTRIPAYDMLAQMVVYPFQQGMIVALAGLPVYILLLGFGSIGLQELFVLYLLFALLSMPVPGMRTPAFAERSPEEVGQELRNQERAAGCVAVAVVVALIPGTILAGTALFRQHLIDPNFGARIPPEVWPALPAMPITFAWVIVRVLTAPYTWFGLPIPLWVMVIPLLFLIRLTALWRNSLYLRVAHPQQIDGLPDVPHMARWRGFVWNLFWIAVFGYVWQPLLETNVLGKALWTTRGLTLSHNLASALYVFAIIGFVMALHRVRRIVTKSSNPLWQAVTRQAMEPFVPALLALVIDAVSMPKAMFSAPVGSMLLWLVPTMATSLWMASRLGPGTDGLWQFLLFVPLAAPFAPVLAVSSLGALSPLMVLFSSNPVARDFLTQATLPYNVPAWWLAALGPLVGGAMGPILTRWCSPLEQTPQRRGQQVTVHGVPVSLHADQAATGNGLHADLDFILEPETAGTPAHTAVIHGPPPVIAPPPIHHGRAPQPYPARVATNGPFAGPLHPSQRPAASEWRWRPLSPIAAGVLRWLSGRTDNPVTIYSARRTLPGTLNSDQIAVGILALLFGLFVAYTVPQVFWAFLFPVTLTPLLYPGMPAAVRPDDPAMGLAYLVTAMVCVTLFSPTNVCRTVANGFRLERERATLGFLLVTPLSSVGVAIGHCVGALLPAFALWLGSALLALIPTVLLSNMIDPLVALWGWLFGFTTSLMYLAMCVVTGAWIGITEEKARDMTIGVYFLPATLTFVGAFLVMYLSLSRKWGYWPCVAVFVAVTLCLLVLMWMDALRELRKMRQGDVAFEGRAVSN